MRNDIRYLLKERLAKKFDTRYDEALNKSPDQLEEKLKEATNPST